MTATDQTANTPTVEAFRRLTGVWRSRGYGLLLQIEEDRFVSYEETAISCIAVHSGPLEELAHAYGELVVSPGEQAFSARRATGITRISFYRLERLPDAVGETERRDMEDPEYNFEVFWRTFAEQYALFDLKKVDWDQVYDQFRPRISSDSQAEDLFATFVAMLRPLEDGHVRLTSSWAFQCSGTDAAI